MTHIPRLKELRKIYGKKHVKKNTHKNRVNRKFGIGSLRCDRCGRYEGHIRSFGLNFCRQCFREIAPRLGFKKYR